MYSRLAVILDKEYVTIYQLYVDDDHHLGDL